jgi:hypothetical protein
MILKCLPALYSNATSVVITDVAQEHSFQSVAAANTICSEVYLLSKHKDISRVLDDTRLSKV